MRRALAGSLFLLLAAGAFALPGGPGYHGLGGSWMGGSWSAADAAALNAEIMAVLDQQGSTQIGTMTVADLEKLAGEVSIVIQKDAYVRRTAAASFFMPGVGQFRTGDTLGGVLFLSGDILLVAGTLAGAYYLLPSNVQFASLDYLNTPLAGIRSTWESNTLSSYGPSIAVAMGGMAAQMILRWVASRSARDEARSAVESGRVTFQPQIVPWLGPVGPRGEMGFGFGVHAR